MVELVLHIGMGKTGTTSIQNALLQNAAELSRHRTEYLGMWFTAVDVRFEGLSGQKLFFGSSPDQLTAYADQFADFLLARASQTENTRFIISNESLFENVAALVPFVSRLRQRVATRLIAYVRDPAEWLPSAYNQWMIFHKTNVGPIKQYSEAARQLVGIYDNITIWSREYQDAFTLRAFEKSMNMVEDFGQLLAMQLNTETQRQQERVDLHESLLRAIYNGRKSEETLPYVFNHAIGHVDLSQAPRLDQLVNTSFVYDETELVIAERRATFEFIRDVHGIDFMARKPADPAPDVLKLRERALEQLLLLVMDQADRITMLEERLQALSDRLQE